MYTKVTQLLEFTNTVTENIERKINILKQNRPTAEFSLGIQELEDALAIHLDYKNKLQEIVDRIDEFEAQTTDDNQRMIK